jgi:hypothetical protein
MTCNCVIWIEEAERSSCVVGRWEKRVVYYSILMPSIFCAATLILFVVQRGCLPSGAGEIIGGNRDDDERTTNEGRHHPAGRPTHYAAVGVRQSAAHQLRTEAQRERDIQRSASLQDLVTWLEIVTPHMLLHSLARRMLERGAQLPEVQ